MFLTVLLKLGILFLPFNLGTLFGQANAPNESKFVQFHPTILSKFSLFRERTQTDDPRSQLLILSRNEAIPMFFFVLFQFFQMGGEQIVKHFPLKVQRIELFFTFVLQRPPMELHALLYDPTVQDLVIRFGYTAMAVGFVVCYQFVVVSVPYGIVPSTTFNWIPDEADRVQLVDTMIRNFASLSFLPLLVDPRA